MQGGWLCLGLSLFNSRPVSPTDIHLSPLCRSRPSPAYASSQSCGGGSRWGGGVWGQVSSWEHLVLGGDGVGWEHSRCSPGPQSPWAMVEHTPHYVGPLGLLGGPCRPSLYSLPTPELVVQDPALKRGVLQKQRVGGQEGGRVRTWLQSAHRTWRRLQGVHDSGSW